MLKRKLSSYLPALHKPRPFHRQPSQPLSPPAPEPPSTPPPTLHSAMPSPRPHPSTAASSISHRSQHSSSSSISLTSHPLPTSDPLDIHSTLDRLDSYSALEALRSAVKAFVVFNQGAHEDMFYAEMRFDGAREYPVEAHPHGHAPPLETWCRLGPKLAERVVKYRDFYVEGFAGEGAAVAEVRVGVERMGEVGEGEERWRWRLAAEVEEVKEALESDVLKLGPVEGDARVWERMLGVRVEALKKIVEEQGEGL